MDIEDLLKKGYTLSSRELKRIKVFKKEDIYYVKNDKYLLKLKKEAFYDLYGNLSYEVINENKEDLVDELKDKEYYSWKQ